MNKNKWQMFLAVFLVVLSIVFYLMHYFIFKDAHHIFIYLLGDIAFIPIEVLIVTIIIHQLLEIREKRSIIKKLNMVIGCFFSEVGTHLLKNLSLFNAVKGDLEENFLITNKWSNEQFSHVIKKIKKYDFILDSRKSDLEELKRFLVSKREFLLRLLENPNLLEHEEFTELLWAVFHLTEELFDRHQVKKLRDADYEHISGDIKRVYRLLIKEWVMYMKHLKIDYPYLFSLAVRTNPFDPQAEVELS